LVTLFAKVRIWIRVGSITVSILTNEGPVHIFGPAINRNIMQIDFLARVASIASNDTRINKSALLDNILESDVSNIDEWLRLTSFEWVSKAAWTRSVWLFLLLWSNIDSKPNWEVNIDVFIEDVPDFTRA
jgi:hypothetical protein